MIDDGEFPAPDPEDIYDRDIAAHKQHIRDGIPEVTCAYCRWAAVAHGRPDPSEDIPRINDSRGIPDGEGAQ